MDNSWFYILISALIFVLSLHLKKLIDTNYRIDYKLRDIERKIENLTKKEK